MKKKFGSLPIIFFLTFIIGFVFYTLKPTQSSNETLPLSEFSAKRALNIVATISKNPHFVGSKDHQSVSDYIIRELITLGLEPEIQEGYSLTEWGNFTKSKNIIARIKGSGSEKALLLLSHYDSAPHSKSHGAADDASGVATVLEGVRAYLHKNPAHKNDIIILFTDAEELGLNGAAVFVKQHLLAKSIGLAINFEARGTSGPSYMLMEVNQGNSEMVTHFAKSHVPFPACNSLMYSIYKMLPNDTDLTIFREHGKIQGFNFAFIDDHFNYHTQQDDLSHLSTASLAHQGSYLMPLLHHFANVNLNSLSTAEDSVYFSIPFGFVSYPFSWNFPLLIISIVIFFGLIFLGFGKRLLTLRDIGKGSFLFTIALVITSVFAYVSWEILRYCYPQYSDIQQGFTYNGHSYIIAFISAGLGICFLVYRRLISATLTMNYTVAPILFWVVINLIIVITLPGAGFFIVPVISALIGFAYFIVTQKTSAILNAMLSIPVLVIIVPFMVTLPVGLGLKMLYAAVLFGTLVFGLLQPLFGTMSGKRNLALLLFGISIGFMIYAHLNSGYEEGKAKPNSLVYYYDADKKSASWASYDREPDDWTKTYLGDHPKTAGDLNRFKLYSKYNAVFKWRADAPLKALNCPQVDFVKDTVIGNFRYLDIKITPKRDVNRYDIFAAETMKIYNLRVNGMAHVNQNGALYKRSGAKILSNYVVDNEPFELQFAVEKTGKFDMSLLESSFDLLENPQFAVKKRPAIMMPAPFVLNDAVIIRQEIKPTTVKKLIVAPPPENIIIQNAEN
ncbi:M20/M25/M40 family metallo-hydrolase [Flavobacterium sp.]|uniref:M20/M25/M40 family metallo-hydrolase n=1 Tax=Flavobacterium sp. TaxID=239 RepID=UPI002612FCB2|nr:M20/M25/M40 family metallo-hydrolase [Flavobacterium sp.]